MKIYSSLIFLLIVSSFLTVSSEAVCPVNVDLFTFGQNFHGRLGLNRKDSLLVNRPTIIEALFNYTIVDIASASQHSLALDSAGNVHSFGSNSKGQLCLGISEPRQQIIPSSVTLISNIVSVHAGEDVSGLMHQNGSVFVCGGNSNSMFGFPSMMNESFYSPMLVNFTGFVDDGDLRLKTFCLGERFALYVMGTGTTVLAVGENGYGQLGLGDRNNRYEFTKLDTSSFPAAVRNISCVSYHTLILLENDEVYGFGQNMYYQLGLGNNRKDILTPTNIQFPASDFKGISMIATGYHTSYFVGGNDQRNVVAVGRNTFGELGIGKFTHNVHLDTNDTLDFPIVMIPEKVSNISCFYFHCLAITDSGNVYGFGRAQDGQLGAGDQFRHRANPYRLPLVTGLKMKKVTVGNYNSLLLAENGTLYSMGTSFFGELGQNLTNNEQRLPTQISRTSYNPEGLQRLSPCRVSSHSGGHHTVSTTLGGTAIFPYGLNSFGQYVYRSSSCYIYMYLYINSFNLIHIFQ